ncbi:hypothetical protein LY76DRAFT_688243, partial [Colletotrichum caudatum]
MVVKIGMVFIVAMVVMLAMVAMVVMIPMELWGAAQDTWNLLDGLSEADTHGRLNDVQRGRVLKALGGCSKAWKAVTAFVSDAQSVTGSQNASQDVNTSNDPMLQELSSIRQLMELQIKLMASTSPLISTSEVEFQILALKPAYLARQNVLEGLRDSIEQLDRCDSVSIDDGTGGIASFPKMEEFREAVDSYRHRPVPS